MVKKNPIGWEINPISGNKEAPIKLPPVESWADMDEFEERVKIKTRKKKAKKPKSKRKTKGCGCK